MTPTQFPSSDKFGFVVTSSIAKYRVVLVTVGVAIVALVAWRWAVSGESRSPRGLEITVLDVRDIAAPAPPVPPAAITPDVAPPPPAAVPEPAAVVDPEPHTVAAPARPAAAPARPAASRAVNRTPPVKSSPPRPATAAKSVADEPRAETAPAKPAPARTDAPPLETNPYVYK